MMSVRAIVLAAGKGTRMKSATPKVLHEICGKPMLWHVLRAVRDAGADDVLVVVNEQCRDAVAAMNARVVVQEPQDGTGHAVQLAMEQLHDGGDAVLVVSGDMPLVPAELLRAVMDARASTGAPLALVTACVRLPSYFGRIVRSSGRVTRIVELKDATPAEAQIDEVNAGIYCFASGPLRAHLAELRPDNAQRELYLTDVVSALAASGERIETVESKHAADVIGVNDRRELAHAQALVCKRILDRHMLAGVTVTDPRTTYVDEGVEIGQDTVLGPNSHLHGATSVGRNCAIGPNALLHNVRIADNVGISFSVARDCELQAGVTIGPFAHLRGGSVVESGARVGNFVELKKTRLGKGAKASHLAYLGDTDVGEDTNIGAGTITCNYDGVRKNKTKIGKRVFVGSNSSLVAPIELGDDSMTGAGSVVIRDVGKGERVVGNPARPLPKKRSPDSSAK